MPDSGTFAQKHISRQLWRAASGASAHYAEARCAESRADFVHKTRLAAKEMREALHWVRLQHRISRGSSALLALVREADELIAILIASANTARRPQT